MSKEQKDRPAAKKHKPELGQLLRSDIERALGGASVVGKLLKSQRALWTLILAHLTPIDTGKFALASPQARDLITIDFARDSMKSVLIDFRSQCFLSPCSIYGSDVVVTASSRDNLSSIMRAYATAFCFTRDLTIKENPNWLKIIFSDVDAATEVFLERMLSKEDKTNWFVERNPTHLYAPLRSLVLDINDNYNNMPVIIPRINSAWIRAMLESSLQTLRLFQWDRTALGPRDARIWTSLERLELHGMYEFHLPEDVTTRLQELKLPTCGSVEAKVFWERLGSHAPRLHTLWMGNVTTILDEENGFLQWLQRKETTQKQLRQLVFIDHALFNHFGYFEEYDADGKAEERKRRSGQYLEILFALADCTGLQHLEFCLPWSKVHAHEMTMEKLFRSLNQLQVLRMGSTHQSPNACALFETAARYLPALRVLQADDYHSIESKRDSIDYKQEYIRKLCNRLEILPFTYSEGLFEDVGYPLLFPNLKWLSVVDTSMQTTPLIVQSIGFGDRLVQALPRLSGAALEGFICPGWTETPFVGTQGQGWMTVREGSHGCIPLSDALFAALGKHHQLRHIYIEGDGQLTSGALRSLAGSCSQLVSFTLHCGVLRGDKPKVHEFPHTIDRQQLDINIDTITDILEKCPILRWLSFGTFADEKRSTVVIGHTQITAKQATALWHQSDKLRCTQWPMSRRTCIQFITRDNMSYCNAPSAYYFPNWILGSKEAPHDDDYPSDPKTTGFRLYTRHLTDL